MQNQKNNNDKDWLKTYAKYSGIFFQMLVIIGGGTWLGSHLDKKRAGDFPLFTVILSLSAVGIALYLVIKQVLNDK